MKGGIWEVQCSSPGPSGPSRGG